VPIDSPCKSYASIVTDSTSSLSQSGRNRPPLRAAPVFPKPCRSRLSLPPEFFQIASIVAGALAVPLRVQVSRVFVLAFRVVVSLAVSAWLKSFSFTALPGVAVLLIRHSSRRAGLHWSLRTATLRTGNYTPVLDRVKCVACSGCRWLRSLTFHHAPSLVTYLAQ